MVYRYARTKNESQRYRYNTILLTRGPNHRLLASTFPPPIQGLPECPHPNPDIHGRAAPPLSDICRGLAVLSVYHIRGDNRDSTGNGDGSIVRIFVSYFKFFVWKRFEQCMDVVKMLPLFIYSEIKH
jgi:hypothetical protein